MRPLAVAAIALSIAGSTYWVLSPDSSPVLPSQEAVGVPKVNARMAETIEGTAVESVPGQVPDKAEPLRQRIETLEVELRAVIARRHKAEAALLQAEHDVTELEQYLQEIKARGEDPSEYEAEGMARFKPAFDAYQKAYEDRETAIAREDSISAELMAAEQALANQ